MQFHKLKKNESRDQDGEPVYLTQKAIEQLREKLARLKESVPRLALEAQRTAAYGDRSDNAEYKQAKGSLRRAHYQIFEIETKLRHAVVITVGSHASGTVQLGSTVVLETVGSDDANPMENTRVASYKTFEILGPDETDPAHGRISHVSPLGAALVGHAPGDVVTVRAAGGHGRDAVRTYRIIEIR